MREWNASGLIRTQLAPQSQEKRRKYRQFQLLMVSTGCQSKAIERVSSAEGKTFIEQEEFHVASSSNSFAKVSNNHYLGRRQNVREGFFSHDVRIL